MSDDLVLAALIRLEAGLGSLHADLEASQTSLRAEMTSLRADMTSLRVDVMARIDRLENKIGEIRDDIAVNFGTVDAVRRANDNTRDQLRLVEDQVSVMFGKIMRLETRIDEIASHPL